MHTELREAEKQAILRHCSTYRQFYLKMKEFEEGRCDFCDVDREFNEVLWEDEHTLVWSVPESIRKSGLKHQFLIVPKEHIRFPWDATPSEHFSTRSACLWLAHEHGIDEEGGMFFARFGDISFNAGSMAHLHYNLWVPDGTKEVRVPIYKSPERIAENNTRVAHFRAIYEKQITPDEFEQMSL